MGSDNREEYCPRVGGPVYMRDAKRCVECGVLETHKTKWELREQLATAIVERDAARAAMTEVASANVFYAAAIAKVTKELEFGDWPAAHWASRMRVHNLVAELRLTLASNTEGNDG